jgi:hypothetical protein
MAAVLDPELAADLVVLDTLNAMTSSQTGRSITASVANAVAKSDSWAELTGKYLLQTINESSVAQASKKLLAQLSGETLSLDAWTAACSSVAGWRSSCRPVASRAVADALVKAAHDAHESAQTQRRDASVPLQQILDQARDVLARATAVLDALGPGPHQRGLDDIRSAEQAIVNEMGLRLRIAKVLDAGDKLVQAAATNVDVFSEEASTPLIDSAMGAAHDLQVSGKPGLLHGDEADRLRGLQDKLNQHLADKVAWMATNDVQPCFQGDIRVLEFRHAIATMTGDTSAVQTMNGQRILLSTWIALLAYLELGESPEDRDIADKSSPSRREFLLRQVQDWSAMEDGRHHLASEPTDIYATVTGSQSFQVIEQARDVVAAFRASTTKAAREHLESEALSGPRASG